MGKNYTATLQNDPEIIIYNIAYHMGLIYEDFLYLFGGDIMGDDISQLSDDDQRARWFQVGQHIGDIIVEIFGRTGGYEYPEVTIDYPIEFDEDWSIELGADLV